MNAYNYVPEIDIMLRAGNFEMLAARADADLNAAHITLALAEAVRLLQSELEGKEAELGEAYMDLERAEAEADAIAQECADARDSLGAAKDCAEDLAYALRACSGERRVGDWRVMAADALEEFDNL